MRITANTLKVHWARWDDPGDYPSGAGGAPLPSHHYVEDVTGEVQVVIEPRDYDHGTEAMIEALIDLLNKHAVPEGIMRVQWDIQHVNPCMVSVTVKDFVTAKVGKPDESEN